MQLLKCKKNIVKIFLICLLAGNGIVLINQIACGEELTAPIQTEKVFLKITGISCSRCIPKIKKALKNVHGVKNAVMLTGDIAEVVCEKGTVEYDQLVSALRAVKYNASIIKADEVPKDIKKKNRFFNWLF